MANLLAPITLIGLGRSGTTLLEKAFASVEGCYASGETGGIIFGTYSGALHSFFNTKHASYQSREDFATSVTRHLFSSLFPVEENQYKYWFHKPAGIPKMIWWEKFVTEDDKNLFPTSWYWHTFGNVFPEAKYIAVLRNPWEIIASRVIFSGWPENEGWDDIKVMYDILEKNQENIKFIFFDNLVENPLGVISNLFAELALPIPNNLVDITKEKYVPTDKSRFSEVLAGLNGPPVDDDLIISVRSLWGKYGEAFHSPAGKVDFFKLP